MPGETKSNGIDFLEYIGTFIVESATLEGYCHEFHFGADPEFALMHKNQFKSAISILPEKEKAIKGGWQFFLFRQRTG
jgi:hypothetical protein